MIEANTFGAAGGNLQNTTSTANNDELTRLNAEHRALKARLRELDKHVSLTSAERVEYSQLKKLKLRTKDRIRSLQRH